MNKNLGLVLLLLVSAPLLYVGSSMSSTVKPNQSATKEKQSKQIIEAAYQSARQMPISDPCGNLGKYTRLEILEEKNNSNFYTTITEKKIKYYTRKCEEKKLKDRQKKFTIPSFVNNDEFKRSTNIGFSQVRAKKYYQDANVWIRFGISHYWGKIGVNDDTRRFYINGNVAFAQANESEIYYIDNYKNRIRFAEAYMSEYQLGRNPYGYNLGVGCPQSDCLSYFNRMKGKKLIWRFYNGGQKIADLEISNEYRSGYLDYYKNYKASYK